MAKVTSKLQLTLPKAIADQYRIRPGDDLDWMPAGEAIRVVKRGAAEASEPITISERLRQFDQATDRQRARETRPKKKVPVRNSGNRGWG